MLRPGTAAAKDLLSSKTPDDFLDFFSRYDYCLESVANHKGEKSLVILDKWIQFDFKINVESRTPKYITFGELQKIMEWKLARGKNRPMLKGMLKRNTEENVKKITTYVVLSKYVYFKSTFPSLLSTRLFQGITN